MQKFWQRFLLVGLALFIVLGLSGVQAAAPTAPLLQVSQGVSEEPLLGGQIGFALTAQNAGTNAVTDKLYNLTISNTLPIGLSYISASISPTFIQKNGDDTTTIFWDNISDLEVNETISINLTAGIDGGLTISDDLVNQLMVAANTVPDNSGTWLTAANKLVTHLQIIDIELEAVQSTADEQATGAGEYDGSPAWGYRYRATIQNNNIADTKNIEAVIVLPAGVAYMGGVTIAPNPNGVSTTPKLVLQSDGSLEMTWVLGDLTTAHYNSPVVISFDSAIPYKYRTIADTDAENGAFTGPMSGSIIPEDAVMAVDYEATGVYKDTPSSDGSDSTPSDDPPARVTAEYLTVHKGVSTSLVGIGSTVTYNLNWAVSEYYAVSNAILTDVLPDGMSYKNGSASQTPKEILLNTPGDGETTLVWYLKASQTTPANRGEITFQATVDERYERAPYEKMPVVSGDSLTNKVTLVDDWADQIKVGRTGTVIPDSSSATVHTYMPTFSKDVWDADSSDWSDFTEGFTGDTMTFRLRFDSVGNVDAKGIVIRDFLPRGMSFVNGSDVYKNDGKFKDETDCKSAPTTPTTGTLNGLQYLQWNLCDVTRGSHWEVEIDAIIADSPIIEAGWLVGNFGKLSGHNTYDVAYSLRDFAKVDYTAPELVLTKSATPRINLEGGDAVNYTISVTNNGDAHAYNIALTDIVPADLLITNSGGNGTPQASSYTASSGNPSNGSGGTLQWTTITSLAPGDTETYTYSAEIPLGLIAGQSMTNIASIAYNSRSDDTGHQWATSSNPDDDNTDDETVYLRGVSVSKAPNRALATIGETVRWTLVGTVPTGLVAHHPVIEENNLPNGFEFVSGSTVLVDATLDSDLSHHAANPLDNGNSDVRWFLETIDNSAGTSDYNFTLTFDTLVTGVNPTNTTQTYYNNNCCLRNADNDAYIGWYDTTDGYNGQGYAYDGISTGNIDRRSPQADADVRIRQPYLTINKSSDFTYVVADGVLLFTVKVGNFGNADAHNIVVTDTLPAGLILSQTVGMDISYPDGFPIVTTVMTDTNAVGATDLSYELDILYVGATWNITYSVDVDPAISASLDLNNVAKVASYSSMAGIVGDNNGDGVPDERIYVGPQATVLLHTADGSVEKTTSTPDSELTFGSTIFYTLTVPTTPIPATMYNVVLTDVVDANLQIVNVTNGSATGQTVTASFATIGINQQVEVLIEAMVPVSSTGTNGTYLPNQAIITYDNVDFVESNVVAETLVAPALVVEKGASPLIVVENDVVTYTITIENVGGGLAQNLVISDQLPSNMSYVTGSSVLNGAAIADPVAGEWQLSTPLAGSSIHTLVFQAVVDSVAAGTAYENVVAVSAEDIRGEVVPTDNSTRVPADSDLTDSSSAIVYGGPLACTTESTQVAYEDLKNVGWSDWDYNDLILLITTEQCMTPADELAIINIDYEVIARGAGYNHDFRHTFPVAGNGRFYLTVNTADNDVIRSQTVTFNGDPTLSIFPYTRESLTPVEGLPFPFTNTMPEQTVYEAGQTARVTLVVDDATANPAVVLPPAPWDVYIYVHDTGEEVHRVIPGHLDNTQVVNGTYDPTTPLLGYDLPFAQTFPADWDWSLEFVGLWRGYPQYVDYLDSGETAPADWFELANADTQWLWQHAPNRAVDLQNMPALSNQPTNRYFASPTTADLDDDGSLEIIMVDLISYQVKVFNAQRELVWQAGVGGGIKAAATTGDIDNDGNLEVIVGSEDGKVYAFNHDGSPVTGFPVTVSTYRLLAMPAIANLDNSGTPEIIVPAADGRLYVLNGDGTPKWDRSLGDVKDTFGNQVINSSPVVADLDGDGTLEIVVGSYDKQMYAHDGSGNLLWQFATGDVVLSSPLVVDVTDNAGKETFFGSGDGHVYLLDKAGNLIWRRLTAWTIRSSGIATDMDNDGDLELIIGNDDDRVWAWHHNGILVDGWPQTTDADVFSSPAVGDIDGDGQDEIVVGSDSARVYAWEMDGTIVEGWYRETSASVKGRPVLLNLDDDAALEVIVGDFNGQLYVWGMPLMYQLYLPIVHR